FSPRAILVADDDSNRWREPSSITQTARAIFLLPPLPPPHHTRLAAAEPPVKRPNIIFILADDLGHGDLGCYGQTKIKTPNIDRMAKQGMRFTQAYAGSTVCAPSRCVLMTGKHTGHAHIRGNAL